MNGVTLKTSHTFIHSRSSLKSHTRFQTKMGKVGGQNGAKTLLDGAVHTYIDYIREYPPGVSSVPGDTWTASLVGRIGATNVFKSRRFIQPA